MKITNRLNLPEPIVRACTGSTRPPHQEKRISVTQLLQPAQLRRLSQKHWSQLTEDVSDRVWLLLGTGLHYTLEKHRADDLYQLEVRFESPVRSWTVTGIADVVTLDGTIFDYKVTSAWSFLHGIKPEWEQQLNLYAYLAAGRNYDIKSLKIIAILRDWAQSRARDSADYPQQAIGTFDVPLWDEQDQYGFLVDRIEAHAAETPAPCTDEERWASGECWAIMKGQNKRATKLHQTLEDAQSHWRALEGKPYWIEYREPTYRRCEDYCPVRNYCKQWRQE